jgi:hypothetical protein
MIINKLRTFSKNEQGSVFITALIILIFGSLVLGPLLSYIGTGINTSKVFEEEVAEYYDADAGIEEAILQLQNDFEGIIDNGTGTIDGYPFKGIINGMFWKDVNGNGTYIGEEEDELVSPYSPVMFTLLDSPNGNGVEVLLQGIGDTLTYLVISESPADGTVDSDLEDPTWTGTRIEAFVNDITIDLTDIMENVITGKGTDSITILPEGSDYVQPEPPDEHAPEEYTGGWPDPDDVIRAFEILIKNEATEYGSDTLELTGDLSIDEPFYHDGPLTISSDDKGNVLTLNADMYITGQTVLGGSKEWDLILNGHTIFIESPLEAPPKPALEIEGDVTLTNIEGVDGSGSGAIIAIGDIYFEPNMDTSADDYIFIMSVSGKTEMQPNGNFYGTLAGEAVVTRQGTATINWSQYPPDLVIPGLITHLFFGTASYEIDEGRRY